MAIQPSGVTDPGQLRELAGELCEALAVWATRTDLGSRAAVRRAASEAVGVIDVMLATLHAVRRELIGEIRVYDDATAVRIEALLTELRAERYDRGDPETGARLPKGVDGWTPGGAR